MRRSIMTRRGVVVIVLVFFFPDLGALDCFSVPTFSLLYSRSLDRNSSLYWVLVVMQVHLGDRF